MAKDTPNLIVHTLLTQFDVINDWFAATEFKLAVTFSRPSGTAISDWEKSIWKNEEVWNCLNAK